MAPKNKFTKEEMTAAAVDVVRKKGMDALTAKVLAYALGISTQPVFTCFGTMGNLKKAVRDEAERLFVSYTDEGLKSDIPFLGYGTQYIRFAKEEPELYRLLFLTPSEKGSSTSIGHPQESVRSAIMQFYGMNERDADRFFRDMWLVVHSVATLSVTGACRYSDEEILKMMTGFSVSVLKAIKEIDGFSENDFDRDAVFRSIIGKSQINKDSGKA